MFEHGVEILAARIKCSARSQTVGSWQEGSEASPMSALLSSKPKVIHISKLSSPAGRDEAPPLPPAAEKLWIEGKVIIA